MKEKDTKTQKRDQISLGFHVHILEYFLFFLFLNYLKNGMQCESEIPFLEMTRNMPDILETQ